MTETVGARFRPPEEWCAMAPHCDGSWWPAWRAWLARHSGPLVAPPSMGAPEKGYPPLDEAPGSYVHLR
jgi:polyhydroxyalkanoate synthase